MSNGADDSGVLRLGELAPAREGLAAGDFQGAWARCAEALRERPFHPEAVRLAGEIARAAGDAATARLCFGRAAAMAPGLKPSQSDFSGIEQPPREWPGLDVVLGTTPSRLSVCLIAKDEEAFLERCLKSVQSVAAEIIVVDTGSTDRTVDIAQGLGAKVLHFPWIDDFSAARNAGLAQARGDWVLILDADEELAPDAGRHLRAEMANAAAMAFNLPLINEGREEEGAVYLPRLFRNLPGASFEGRVHEQILPGIIARTKGWGLGIETSRATLLHHGYTAAVTAQRDKPARNLRLLQKALDEAPEDPLARAFLRANLGLETVRTGHLAAGIGHYEAALELLNSIVAGKTAVISPEFRASFLHQLAPYYHRAGRAKDVLALYQTPLARMGELSASDHYQLGLAYGQTGDYKRAAEAFRACLDKRRLAARAPHHAVVLGHAPYQCLASAMARLKRATEAEKTYQHGLREHPQAVELAVEYAKFKLALGRTIEAMRDANSLLTADPASVDLWALGAEIALSDPKFTPMAADWTEEALQRNPPNGRLASLRAEALLLSGNPAGAVQLLKSANAPADPAPRSVATRAFCALLDETLAMPVVEAPLENAVSRAFLDLFRRVGMNRQTQLAAQAKSQAGRLPLPTAAEALGRFNL